MLKDVKAVIFDLDGTLLDSMWMWKAIDVEYFGRFGHELPEDYQTAIAGMSFTETAVYSKERFNLPDDLDTIKADWNRMAYEKYKNEVFFKEGAKDFVLALKRHGIKTGIATSNSKELLDVCMDSLGGWELFDEIHNTCEVKRGKPAPDIYLYVAEKLSVKPSECLVFEDIMPGIQAGHNAGMKVCAVWDAHAVNEEEQIKNEADYYIKSFKDIKI